MRLSNLRRLAAVSVVSVSVVAGVLAFAGLAVEAGVSRPAVTLLFQSSYVSANEGAVLSLSVQLSPVIVASVANDSRLVLTAHRPISSRSDVRSAIEGDLPQIIDAVSFPLTDLLAQASSESAPGRIDLSIRTEMGTRTPEALQMSAAGTYPLTIDVESSGERVTRLVSFVERLDQNSPLPTASAATRLALVGKIDAEVSLGADSRTVISPAVRDEMLAWTNLLERRPGLAMTVALRPELVDSFTRSEPQDQDLLIRFQRAAGFEAMSTTYVAMDPTDADRHGLSNVFTRQLRLGESTLGGLFPGLVTPRHSWMQSDPLSTGGARILADLGFRTVILSAGAVGRSIDSTEAVDPTRLVDLAFSDEGSISAAMIDGELANILDRGSTRPAGGEHLVALQLLAELKALLFDVSNEDEQGPALLLSTSTGEMPTPTMTEALVDVISRDPRFSFTSLDDALERMTSAESTERIELSDLLDSEPVHPTSANLALVVAGLDSTIDSFASALPAGDERVRDWRRLVDVVADNRLGSAERQAYVDSIRTGSETVAASVVPPASTTFTLGGRDSPIRFTIRNDGPTDLEVLVRLRSSKLRLPEGDKIVTLLAGASTAVEFAVNARSNGRFPVTLQLLTPDGAVVLGTPATLTARVNALAGLGQLVTGIALLFLASWWANHFRRERRRKQEEADLSSRRHPSVDRHV